MPVSLTLRSTSEFSPYREQLKRLITAPKGNSVLLCSGYIQEMQDYSVLDDDLLDTLREGCVAGRLITISGMSKSEDK